MKLRYTGSFKIVIPSLKSKGGVSLKLPLTNYNTMRPQDEQIIEVSENEAADLIRSWPNSFEVVKIKKIKEVVDNDSENRL